MLIHNLLLLSFLSATSFSFNSSATDRIGEVANFDLDKSRSRTTSLISTGSVKTQLIAYNSETAESKASYTTQIDYDLDILMVGHQQGSEKPMIEESFFNEEFIARLRQEQEIQTDSFKVKHLGYDTASNKDGTVYENCDIVLFYDINMGISSEINHLVRSMLANMDDDSSDSSDDSDDTDSMLEDISVKMARKSGLPVLSVAKLDVAGRHSGIRFKAGFDYVRNLDIKK